MMSSLMADKMSMEKMMLNMTTAQMTVMMDKMMTIMVKDQMAAMMQDNINRMPSK